MFEGKSDKLTGATPALVVGNKIEKIADDIAGRRKQLEMSNGTDLFDPDGNHPPLENRPRHLSLVRR